MFPEPLCKRTIQNTHTQLLSVTTRKQLVARHTNPYTIIQSVRHTRSRANANLLLHVLLQLFLSLGRVLGCEVIVGVGLAEQMPLILCMQTPWKQQENQQATTNIGFRSLSLREHFEQNTQVSQCP
jgi:hypothetical protein